MNTWRERMAFSGYCLVGLAYLIGLAQLGAWWRFGNVDQWLIQASLIGTPENWLLLAYIAAVVILLSAKE